jgi:hypothetical protein
VSSPALTHFALLVAGLAVDGTVQVAWCRAAPRLGWIRSILVGFAAGAAALAALEAAAAPALGQSPADLCFTLLAVFGTYAAAGFFYFNVVNGRKSALRVRLLRELREAQAGLTVGELLERYPPEGMVEARLERMLGHGQILERGGRWFVRRGALWLIARAMFAAKLLVIGKRSEFA